MARSSHLLPRKRLADLEFTGEDDGPDSLTKKKSKTGVSKSVLEYFKVSEQQKTEMQKGKMELEKGEIVLERRRIQLEEQKAELEAKERLATTTNTQKLIDALVNKISG